MVAVCRVVSVWLAVERRWRGGNAGAHGRELHATSQGLVWRGGGGDVTQVGCDSLTRS